MNAAPAYLDRMGRAASPQQLKPCAIIRGRRDEDPFTRWDRSRNAECQVVMPVCVAARGLRMIFDDELQAEPL